MADFYGTMKKVQNNVSITENGMQGYKTTFHPLLDMNFKVTSYRKTPDSQIKQDLADVMASQDYNYILKFLFMVRDVREGLGERRLFRVALKELIENYNFNDKDTIVSDLITNQIKEYGRFDDLLAVFNNTKYEKVVFETIHNQLKSDWSNMNENKPISLLAKWLPSINTSSKETRALANKLVKVFGINQKQYRQTLSALRAYLKVIETYTSANEWDKIDYNQVPSKANLKYKDAFLKHDEERRRDYLAALRVGVDKEGKVVKINSTVNYPHEIVSKYSTRGYWSDNVGNYDEALEQLWKNLKQKDGLNNTIVVRDGSGSMTSTVGNGETTALHVSTALAIYCSEHLNAEFKDKFLTFSSRAKLIDLSGETSLHNKLAKVYRENDCSNTNIQDVFDVILNTAVKGNIKSEDMPKQILIISDMEFDGHSKYFNANSNVFENADKEYRNAGYKLPKLVFWNVCSRTNTIPLTQNENGVVLVSGFSVNTLNMVLNGETDPWLAFVKELDTPRYASIALINNGKKTNSTEKTVNKVKNIGWL